MDESWRTCMGMSTANRNHPPRKSMETVPVTDHNLDVADFSDVFGGPPRSVLRRNMSGHFTRSTFFYEEFFRPPELFSSRSMNDVRNLSAFKIPVREEGFYSDIFGDDQRRSRERSRSNSKGKSNSSSVLSSEELSPLRPVIGDDVGLSHFASKLRPVNVPSRWNSTTIMTDIEEVKQHQQQQQRMLSSPSNRSFYNENLYMQNYNNNNNVLNNLTRSSSYNYGFNRRAISPVEVINNSPSSPSFSLCHEPVRAPSGSNMHQQDDDDEEEEEIMSSYVIDINSDFRESNDEAVSIDEAIAWAKERYNTHSSNKSQSIETEGEM